MKQVVLEKASGLEGEMDTLLRFAREKLAEFAPDAMRKVFESRIQSNEEGGEEGKDGYADDGTTADAAKEGKEEADKVNEEWRLEQVRAVCCACSVFFFV